MVRTTLSPKKLKKLFNSFSLYSTSTYTKRLSSPPSVHRLPPSHFIQNPLKTLFPVFLSRPFCSQPKKIQSLSLIREGNYDDSNAQNLKICLGCGVPMQDSDSKQPGFFTLPKLKSKDYKFLIDKDPILDESEISDSLKKGLFDENVAPQVDESIENPDENLSEKPVVCTRCHSLRYYGKVKDPNVENLLPDFDFDHTVGRRLTSTTGARSVVMMVVDASDFDGSFPKKVANLVSKVIHENSSSWQQEKPGNAPRILLVVTKIDLLPSSIHPTTLRHWVRTRAREGGANHLTRVHLVSATRDWGVENLVEDVIDLAGPRGKVWAIGAQNAGKSTLINAIGKCVGGNVTHLTEAPVRGTTLGILRVEGVLPGKAKLFDTPGLLHPHQISTRLTSAEHKLVNITKELKPRTYRIMVGHSIHIGGLVRLDIEASSDSVKSLYVTVWASPHIPLHMGKTENAKLMLEEQFGRQLQPPIGAERVEELGKWVRKEFHVKGSWWDLSCVDIAISGLGWFAIGLKGDVQLGVWTYDGVEVISRDALLPQRSHNFEVTGYTVSEIVSKADRALNKNRKNDKRKSNEGSKTDRSDNQKDLTVVDPPVDSSSSPSVVVSKADRALNKNRKNDKRKSNEGSKTDRSDNQKDLTVVDPPVDSSSSPSVVVSKADRALNKNRKNNKRKSMEGSKTDRNDKQKHLTVMDPTVDSSKSPSVVDTLPPLPPVSAKVDNVLSLAVEG